MNDEAQSFSPHTGLGSVQDCVDYTDLTGTKISIPMSLLVRLYDGSKYHHESRGGNWDYYCNALFENFKKYNNNDQCRQ